MLSRTADVLGILSFVWMAIEAIRKLLSTNRGIDDLVGFVVYATVVLGLVVLGTIIFKWKKLTRKQELSLMVSLIGLFAVQALTIYGYGRGVGA